ncbi:MAG: hypothetical protein ACJASY_001152 [Halioglobus sp.]|jgi:hypothetical protein
MTAIFQCDQFVKFNRVLSWTKLIHISRGIFAAKPQRAAVFVKNL